MTSSQLDAWLAATTALMDRGDFAAARTVLLEATRLHPDSARAWKALGVSENKLGNAEAAEAHLRRSLGLDDADADAWSSLGGVYVALARYEEALKAFERGFASGPPDTYSLLNYLTMAVVAGDYESALRRYSSALRQGQRECEGEIKRGENVPWCYYDLAQILFFKGNVADSLASLRQAIERSTDWQAASARRTYALLASSGLFRSAAADIMAAFVRYSGDTSV